MISGIIKLFYNDKVKSEMKKMKDESYIFSDECKKFKKINKSIDDMILYVFKVVIISFIITTLLKYMSIVGYSLLFLMITHVIYKKIYEYKIERYCIDNDIRMRYNINSLGNKINYTNIKVNIISALTIFMIGLVSEFNYIIIICLTIVFIDSLKKLLNKINSN